MCEDTESGESGRADAGRPAAEKQPRARRAPKRITRTYLENVALWYLGRFAATAKGLEQVLMCRVLRAARHHGSDPAEGAAMIADIIQRYREAGLLNDRAFAEARAKTLHERGLPVRAIALKLRQQGVAAGDIEAAIGTLAADRLSDAEAGQDGDIHALDRDAAMTYARRRRIGPWRNNGKRAEMRERDLAAMARAGFSYGIAREIIDSDNDEL